jgi:hypothetical protein
MRRLVVLICLCGAAVLIPGMALAQAPAEAPALPALDLSDLGLRLIEARAVDSLPLEKTAMKPEKGMKLVVVGFRGRVPSPGQVTASAQAFSAFYSVVSEHPIPGGQVAQQEQIAKAQARVVDLGSEGAWAPSATQKYPKPKDVLLDVAVQVPAGVNEFFLIYDTAKGKQRAEVKLGPLPGRKF